jgi:hypothetical protein
MMATAWVQPAEACSVLTGKHDTVAVSAGHSENPLSLDVKRTVLRINNLGEGSQILKQQSGRRGKRWTAR